MTPKKARWKQNEQHNVIDPAHHIPPPEVAPITTSVGTPLAEAPEFTHVSHEEQVAEQHHHHHHPGGLMKDTCANCKFAQAHATAGQVWCKRMPPTPLTDGLAIFPVLVDGNWCGEFQKKAA